MVGWADPAMCQDVNYMPWWSACALWNLLLRISVLVYHSVYSSHSIKSCKVCMHWPSLSLTSLPRYSMYRVQYDHDLYVSCETFCCTTLYTALTLPVPARYASIEWIIKWSSLPRYSMQGLIIWPWLVCVLRNLLLMIVLVYHTVFLQLPRFDQHQQGMQELTLSHINMFP